MHFLRKKQWSPYIVGSSIGLLMVASFYFFGSFIGVSSGFVKIVTSIATMLMRSASSQHGTTSLAYVKEYFSVFIIIGIVLGSLFAAYTSNNFITKQVPSLWQHTFGPSFAKRACGAFIGGILVMVGARLAGGCTSGKAIASGLQLLVPAWLFIACLFGTGIIVAFSMYKK